MENFKEKKDVFDTLINAIQKLSIAKNLLEIQNIVKISARKIAGSDGATFVLRDEDKCYYVDEDAISPLWKGKRFPMDTCISGWVMKNRQHAVIDDIYKDYRIPIDAYEPTFVRSLAMVPIRSNDPIGAIGIYWSDNYRATDEELELLKSLADSTAIAIENINNLSLLKKSVEELNEQNKEKEKTLEELEKAKIAAEESDRLKTMFLNNMSHEIRTPLNGIVGFSNFLNDYDITNETRSYYIDIINSSSNQLMKIIDDILEMSQLETKQIQLNMAEFNLNDSLMELVARYTLKSREKNIPLHIKKGLTDPDSIIKTDQAKLMKILDNIIENAFKFTNEGEIEFGYNLEHSKIVFYVKDTGIGISPKYFNSVFQRFVKEENESSKLYGGLGIGLSIAKENAVLLGGEITLDSEKGKGTTFKISIPTNHEATKQKNEEMEQELSVNNKVVVLIAEDEEINYMFIKILFDREAPFEHQLLHAKNGKEAVDICRENEKIDLVLMDIKMPIMNGHEATRQIKSERPNLLIIAQTAYSTESDKELAFKNGFDDFITKPLDKQKLFTVIKSHMKIDNGF